jgi:cobalt-zinc-cadmium efflux system protein
VQAHHNPGVEKRFILSIAITTLVLVAEVIGGIWTGSLALLSDSAHVFMDIFALGLSFLALRLSSLPSDDRHTYGYHRLEVLAALFNGVSLAVIAIGIWWEAYQRWTNPEPIKSVEMLVIATAGLAANLAVAFVLGGHNHTHEHGEEADHEHLQVHKTEDLNLRSAYLHVVGDAISSIGVIVAAVIIWRTNWYWVDPLVSTLIGALIVVSAWRVLRSSLHILIEGVPEGMDINRIGEVIQAVPAVEGVHDLHVWNICSGNVALSTHVVLRNNRDRTPNEVMDDLKQELSYKFGIEHTTIQFEDRACSQR